MTQRGPLTRARLRGLYAIVDDDPRWKLEPVEQARCALEGGARCVQLRAKHTSDARALSWGLEIRSLADAHGALFVMNDRFDLALESEADAVHLGQDDLPPHRIPARLRERLAVGRSTHTLEQARAACREPVDYVAFGPIFETASKHAPDAVQGLARLAQVARVVAPLPLVAIGGLRLDSAAAAIRAGADAVAVISALAGAPDPLLAAQRLARAIG